MFLRASERQRVEGNPARARAIMEAYEGGELQGWREWGGVADPYGSRAGVERGSEDRPSQIRDRPSSSPSGCRATLGMGANVPPSNIRQTRRQLAVFSTVVQEHHFIVRPSITTYPKPIWSARPR